MKTLAKTLGALLIASALLLTSCFKSGNPVFKMIPENALAVITVHPGQLLEKGKMQDILFLKNEAAENEFTKKLLENPETSGIDLEDYSAFFVLNSGGQYGCLAMPMGSKSEFVTFLSDLENESGETLESGLSGPYVTKAGPNMLILYNNSVIMVFTSLDEWPDKELSEVAKSVINLEKEEGLLTDKDFNNFLGKQKDINAWFSTNNLGGMSGIGGMSEGLDVLGGIKNNYGHAFADFQKGYMSLKTNLRFNASWKETIDKYNFMDENAIKELLHYIPSEDLVFIGNTNIDPEKVFGLLKFINKDFKQSLDQMTEQMGVNEEELKDIFEGEVAFSFNAKKTADIDTENINLSGLPGAVYAARIKNESSFERLIEKAGEMNGITEKEGYYSISNGIPVYMVRVKKDMVVSNNEEFIKEIVENGKISKNVTTAPYSDILVSNPVCFFLNLNRDSYSDEIKEMLDENLGDNYKKNAEKFGKQLKSLTFSANLEEWEFRVDLVDTEENSLYTLLKEMDK